MRQTWQVEHRWPFAHPDWRALWDTADFLLVRSQSHRRCACLPKSSCTPALGLRPSTCGAQGWRSWNSSQVARLCAMMTRQGCLMWPLYLLWNSEPFGCSRSPLPRWSRGSELGQTQDADWPWGQVDQRPRAAGCRSEAARCWKVRVRCQLPGCEWIGRRLAQSSCSCLCALPCTWYGVVAETVQDWNGHASREVSLLKEHWRRRLTR